MYPTVTTRETWISPKEIAAELGVSQATIYRAVARGDLRALRLGERGRIRIPRSALVAKGKE